MRNDDLWAIAYTGPNHVDPRAPRRKQIANVLETALCLARPEQTLVILREAERPWWSSLTTAPPANRLEEPFDRGNGTGVLAALLLIADRGPDARVAIVYGQLGAESRALVQRRAAVSGDDESTPRRLNAGVAVAPLSTWLHRALVVDPGRVQALRTALHGHAHDPSAALHALYPFMTVCSVNDWLTTSEEGRPRQPGARPSPTASATTTRGPGSPSALVDRAR